MSSPSSFSIVRTPPGVENATCTGAEAILTAVYNWTSDDKLSPDPSSMLASYLTNANLRFLVHTGIASSLDQSTASEELVGRMYPRALWQPPIELKAFLITFLDEIRREGEDDAADFQSSLKTWKALYSLVLSSEGPRYGMLLGRYANLVFRKIKALPYPDRRKGLNLFFQPVRDALTQSAKDATPSPPSRRDAIFSLASCLFKIFFALDTHKLCSQIMQIVRPHLPRLDATYTLDGSLSQADPDGGERRYYVAAEEVEFRWLVGKWLLGQRRLVEAHKEFSLAFELCPSRTVAEWKNRRLILIPLISLSLLLGRCPSIPLADEFDLSFHFDPLIAAVQTGSFKQWYRGLGLLPWPDEQQALAKSEWLRGMGVLGILREKGEVLVWRALLRKTLIQHRTILNLPHTERYTLPISQFLIALRFSTSDESVTLDDAECICVSLLDQGYIKAYIAHATRTIVFSREDMGFPPVSKAGLALAAQ